MEAPADEAHHPSVRYVQECNAVDVAELFIKAFGEPDAAEAILEALTIDCGANDSSFWREVIIAIAQIRG